MTELPQAVRDMAELAPVEDVMLGLLRPVFEPAGVNVLTVIPDAMASTFPLIIPRRQYSNMHWRGDLRSFTDQAYVQVDTFTQDPNGDEDGALLADAVRVTLRNAWLSQAVEPATGASMSHFDLLNPPRRAGDWANATGPVQYADLPAGAWRYTTVYRITFRYPQ